MKSLVTGGAGFIGSNLIKRLLEGYDNRITSLDNYTTGNIENQHKGCKYIHGDIRDYNKLHQSIKKTSVALLETGEMVTAPEVMTQLLRLQQLLCGYLVTDNGEVEEIPNNRMNVLMETIEEMEGKIIIWSS